MLGAHSGAQARQLTTSDLLRLLAADGAPFAEVAAAVAHRFGGDAESRAWLARTLITLLRDGLLYTEAEKLNAAYLLRFAAPDAPGTREALLHLSLPDSGEAPAVRAWAASLAAAAPAWPAGSPPTAAAAMQQLSAAALLHQRSPRQVLEEAAAPTDGEVAFCGLALGAPPPPLPWQMAEAPASAGSPQQQSPQQWQQAQQAQQQQQQQQRQSLELEVEASLAALAAACAGQGTAVPPWDQQQPPLKQQHHQQLQQLPPAPQQPLPLQQQPPSPPAHHQQLQQPPPAPQQPPPLQQQHPSAPAQHQQQPDQLQALCALLRQAAAAPLVPATQQRLADALHSPAGAALMAPLAEAVGGSGGSSSGGSGSLQPHDMRGLVEHNAPVAAQLLLALAEQHPAAAAVYAAAVAELPMSAQSVECISALVAKAAAPDWVLTTFLANCMQDTAACQDAGRQSRQVRLLCACVGLALQAQPGALAASLPELLGFCVQHSRYKQASDLYRQLRDLQ